MRLLLKVSGQEAMSVVPTVTSANILFDFTFLATIFETLTKLQF